MLLDAQRLGFLGAVDLESHLAHSEAFATVTRRLLLAGAVGGGGRGFAGEGRFRLADLGSGGGAPGLALALRLGRLAEVWLVESSQRRAAFLADALDRLGLLDVASVVGKRAEELGRDERFRGSFDVVTARAFGRPSVTAECGAPLLRPSGMLIVSEPPAAADPGGALERRATGVGRWPADGLARLGLELVSIRSEGSFRFAFLQQVGDCPEVYPRRVGVPVKRPLF